jgi:hypothetical protein
LSGLRLEKQIVLACPEAQQLPSFGPYQASCARAAEGL